MRIEKKYAIGLTAALGLFMAVLDNTVVNVALTPMSEALHTSLQSIEWVITGYFLAQAAVIPAAGYISNRVGIKRMFIICVGLFSTASLLCGLAQSETMLIVFRVLQGLGGGMLFPLAQSIAFGAFPPRERAAASAVVGVPVLLAPAFGPTIGGLLTDSFGWSSIFLVNVPVGVIAIFLAWRIIPADQPAPASTGNGLDVPGLALSMVGVVAIVYAFSLVSQTRPGSATALNPNGDLYGWSYWPVWALLIFGLALLVAFALYELRHRDPVLDLRLFRSRDFRSGSTITWVTSMVIFGSLFLIPVFLEQVRLPHLSALDAGLALMPQGIFAAIAVVLSGRFYDRIGVRSLVLIGTLCLLASSWGLTRFETSTGPTDLLPWLALRGLGFGFANIPVQTLALQAITGRALPKASSLFTASRQIFSSIGVAIVTTLFVQQTASHAQTLSAQATAALPAGTTPDPNDPAFQAARDQILAQAGTSALNDVFILVTGGVVVLLLLVWTLPSRRAQADAAQARADAGAPHMAVAE